MPTNRDGDKTATQAPSAIPQPEGTITQALPADGDPPNASTYAQAYKVCADFIDWLMKPAAKASDWAKSTFRYRTSAGHTRFRVDHLGFPIGRFVTWDEHWPIENILTGSSGIPASDLFGAVGIPYSATVLDHLNGAGGSLLNNFVYFMQKEFSNGAADVTSLKTALYNAGGRFNDALTAGMGGQLAPIGPWLATAVVNSGSFAAGVLPPDNGATKRHRYLMLECGDTAGDYTTVWRRAQSRWDDDGHSVLEWEIYVAAANIPNRHVYVGFCQQAKTPSVDAQNYGVFDLGPSGNWFCAGANAGTPGATDSGVAGVVGYNRFRIEFHGANVADDSARAIRYYINGTLVGTRTTNIPAAGVSDGIAAHVSIVNSAGGASGLTFPVRVGPMRFRQSIYPADVI